MIRHLMASGTACEHRAHVDERPAAAAQPTLRIWAGSERPSRASRAYQTTQETTAEQRRGEQDARGDHHRLGAFQAAVEADAQAPQLQRRHDDVGGDRADDQPGDPKRLVEARPRR